uniref:J domain-containing protein n=1 Tax=viral metagenome TaxID=1070528 RepID=A0A6C0JQ80_9ZZZZ
MVKRVHDIIRENEGKKVESPRNGSLILVGGKAWMSLIDDGYVPLNDGTFEIAEEVKRVHDIIKENQGKKVESPENGRLILVGGKAWMALLDDGYVPLNDGTFPETKRRNDKDESDDKEQPIRTKHGKRIQKLNKMSTSAGKKTTKSAGSASAQRINMPAYPVTREQRNRLEDLIEEMKAEAKADKKDRPAPKLSSLPANQVRISDTLVLRSTPRLVKVIERILVKFANDPHISDPIFVLEKAEGLISDGDKAKLKTNLVNLAQNKYKRDNRISHYIHYRSVDIVFNPIEKDRYDLGVINLNGNWAIKGPQDFVTKFNLQLDGSKNMKYGYGRKSQQLTLDFLAKLDKIKGTEDEMRDAISDEETDELLVKNLFIAYANNFQIAIPADIEVFQVVPDTSDLERSQMIKNYIDLVQLAKNPGIDEFPELKKRIADQIASLKSRLDEVITDVEDLVFFEDFDYKPLPLEEKELVTRIWENAIKKERLTRLKTLKPEDVFVKHGKAIPQMAVFELQIPVPETLRKIVRQHINELVGDQQGIFGKIYDGIFGNIGDTLEQGFYERNDNVETYILAVANVTSKLNLDPRIKLRERVQNGTIDVLSASKDQLLPEIYLNRKLTTNKRMLGRVDRLLNDMRNQEANAILHNWQPAVKKNWFPESLAPNPVRFTWKEYIIDDITGGSCGDNKIYIRTSNGIECVDRQYVIDNIGQFLGWNNRDDLAEWLGVEVDDTAFESRRRREEDEILKQGPISKKKSSGKIPKEPSSVQRKKISDNDRKAKASSERRRKADSEKRRKESAERKKAPPSEKTRLTKLYRKLMLKWHPDKNGGDDKMARHINDAYDEIKKGYETNNPAYVKTGAKTLASLAMI